MRKAKALSLMACSALLAATIAGCSSSPQSGGQAGSTDAKAGGDQGGKSGDRALTYWSPFSGDSQKWDQKRIEAFTKKTGIKVDVQFVPDGGLQNGKLLAAISGGTVPDLVEGSAARAYNFATEDSLMPWDDYLDKIGFDKSQPILPGFKDLMQYKGKTYLVPQDSNVIMLYYNTDMFKEAGLDPDKPPTTLDELDQYAEKLTKIQNGKIERLGFIPWADSGNPFTWQWMFGSKIYDPVAKKLSITDDKSVAAFTWMNKYAQKYDPAKLQSFMSGFGGAFSPDHPFMTGKIAMTVTGNFFTNALRIYAPNVHYKVAKIPTPPGGRTGGSPLGSNIFIIPKGAKNPDLAAEFVKFSLSTEINSDNFDIWRSIPIIDKKFDEVSWTQKNDPIYKIEREVANSENSGHPGLSPVSTQLSDEIVQLRDAVIYNNKDPKPLLQALQDKLQKVIDKK
jgi:multiple sugar transport system substrate-binding protein